MLEYLKNNLILSETETIRISKPFAKKIIDIFQRKTITSTEVRRKFEIEYLEEINAILYKKINFTINKNIEERKLIEAFVMTDNALFYYYKNNIWTGPFHQPLFINRTNDYKLKLKMLSNLPHQYYLENDKLINIKRFINYNGVRANLDYISGIGFRVISNDIDLSRSVKEPYIIDKNTFDKIDEKIISEVFEQNKNIKYKPFYKIEHLKNNDIAIRVFILDNKEVVEVFRLYQYKNDSESYIRIGNSFVKESCNRNEKFLKKIKSGYIDEKLIKNTNAKYFIDILKKYHTKRLPEKVLILLRYPFIEKLYKAGWIKYANIICNNALDGEYGIIKKINELFYPTIPRTVTVKEIELSHLFKINKYQTEKLKEYSNKKNSIEQIISFLKCCLTEDLSSIDNNTFNKTFEWIINFYNKLKLNNENKSEIKYLFYTIKTLNSVFSLEKSMKIIEEFIASMKHIPHYELYFSVYNDTINMLNEINLLKNYNIKVKDNFHLEIMHKEVIELFNSVRRKYENEKFIEKLSNVKDLEFEDENYKIVIPQNCEDLINEGTILHHCVASYIRKIINDLTNIVFIRKIEDPETPFFTVEISNYKTIEQIHGLQNCNIEDEELKKFVEKWANEKELTLNSINKIR